MAGWASSRRMGNNGAYCTGMFFAQMIRLCSNFAALLVCGLLAGNAAFGCDYPRSPAVPNGETATQEEMLEAQQRVRAYVAAAEAYLACLESAEADPENPLPQQQAEINVKRYNAMVEEMHRVSDEYNVAVRIFKSRQ